MNLLGIHQSASKPSLVSSFWSIHAQLPNGETDSLDMKNCSLISLPDVSAQEHKKSKVSRSLTDLRDDCMNLSVLFTSREHEDLHHVKGKENISVNIQEWLQNVQPGAAPPENKT
ncbi:unnamed protein product, partial [Mesorhabditis belari]|uniref:Uncharacterized protein n=1 Tax=Mesorhabditis belari TaxID=2138241 RepID=A0AAF3FJX2_9BILA